MLSELRSIARHRGRQPGAPNQTARLGQRLGLTRCGTRRMGLVAVLVGTAVAAGCGSSPSTSSTTTGAPKASSTSVAPTTAASGSSTGSSSGSGQGSPYYEVKTGQVNHLGTVLVNGSGLTLYMFVPDQQSGHSTCSGVCAQAWPPLRLPAGVHQAVAGSGVKSSLLGTTTRTDGSTQVMYNKWPLYLWVNDTAPGQATGQGINSTGGLWYVMSPDGKIIKTSP